MMAARYLSRSRSLVGLSRPLLFPYVSMISFSGKTPLLMHGSFPPSPPVVSFSLTNSTFFLRRHNMSSSRTDISPPQTKSNPTDLSPPQTMSNRSDLSPSQTMSSRSDLTAYYSLLDWFDKEAIEVTNTTQKLRKNYETIFTKLLADERPVLWEDVEDLHDFKWELSIKFEQMRNLLSKDKPSSKSHLRSIERPDAIYKDLSYRIMYLEEDIEYQFIWFETQMMKVKEMIEKLHKDHVTITQKLSLANDEQDKAVLLEDLKNMFSNLSEKQAKAIHAKTKASKALDLKSKAAELLSCFFVF